MHQQSKRSFIARGIAVTILFLLIVGFVQAAGSVATQEQLLDPLVTEEPTIEPTPTDEPVPDTFQWIAPVGTVTDTIGNPPFQWTELGGVSSYQLFVGRGTVASGLSIVFYEQNLAAATYCAAGTCSIVLPEVNPAAWLFDGEYTAFVKPGTFAWSGPHPFTIDAPQPEAPTILDNTPLVNNQPVLHWNLPGNAAHAAFFQVYIAPANDLATAAVLQWVSRPEACVDWVGTVCNWIPTVNLPNGPYHVYVQSWGAGGFSTGGIGGSGWAGNVFNIGGPTPAQPDANNFVYNVNAGEVTVTFPDDPNTTAIHFFIGNVGVNPIVINFLENLADAQMGCNGTTCSFTPTLAVPLATGTYTVYVQPQSSGGPRGDGILNLGWFAAGTFNVP